MFRFRLFGCLFLVLSAAAVARADSIIIITFDDLTASQIINAGGGDIGSFYSSLGVVFGPNISGLDQSSSGLADAYPPHSSPIVAVGLDDAVGISFSLPQSFVGFYYTSYDPLTATIFDGGGNTLATTIYPANTDGTTGTSDFASFSGTGIASLQLSATADTFVFDDLSFSATSATTVPEPNTLELLALGAIFLSTRGRFRSEE